MERNYVDVASIVAVAGMIITGKVDYIMVLGLPFVISCID